MKGKTSIRFCMPNLSRFRNRVENPDATLTKQIRDILPEVIADVVNGHTLEIRAKFIEKVNDLGLKYKTEAHAAKVNSVLESFFDVVVAATPEALDAICGEDTDEPEAAEAAEAKQDAEDFE